eukprot:TRINITY_DN67507_c0_g1_i1.p1 TRINITY_DN67507_c0_g1~~TRINITY_DN67507_c0_g1_i1.p1  ORF type:complete len:299 (+),score=30.15 TRINITY_DN67507_c0_g1_i1:60-956(+)
MTAPRPSYPAAVPADTLATYDRRQPVDRESLEARGASTKLRGETRPRATQSAASSPGSVSALQSMLLRNRGSGAQDLDFDDEARKLWSRLEANQRGGGGRTLSAGVEGSRDTSDFEALLKRLNLDRSKVSVGSWNVIDPIWGHPTSGGTLFVGNQSAASQLPELQRHGITHVVNCTDSMPLYHEHNPAANIKYMRFDITSHYRCVRSPDEAAYFVQPMLHFVSCALADGGNVMVHCLAGAHRAGTTGIICLMHFAQLSVGEAVPIAKRLRPIIDPIGGFPQLLAFVEEGFQMQKEGVI